MPYQENKTWRKEELTRSDVDLPRLTESDLAKAAKNLQYKEVGCHGVHEEVPLGLAKETRKEVVEFLEKVEQCGKWSQHACTTIFSLNSGEYHE